MNLSKKKEALSASLTDIGQALDEISWQWLSDNFPRLAEAVQAAAADGVTPGGVRRFVMMRTGRDELARRCEQAARWLGGTGGG